MADAFMPTGPIQEGEYYSPEGLASHFSVSIHTIRAWRKRKYLPPAIKLGKLLRWEKKTIDEWAKGHLEKTSTNQRSSLQWKGQALQRSRP